MCFFLFVETTEKHKAPKSKRKEDGNFLWVYVCSCSGRPRYENMEMRRVRIETQINIRRHEGTPGENMFTAPVLLTENDIPGASLHGRNRAEMKKADLLFWLRYRGDSCKGMTVKAQLVKRHVSNF